MGYLHASETEIYEIIIRTVVLCVIEFFYEILLRSQITESFALTFYVRRHSILICNILLAIINFTSVHVDGSQAVVNKKDSDR
jgi:hypothetical protein